MRADFDRERWTQRSLLALVLALGIVIIAGAKAVTNERRHRPARQEMVHAQLQLWNQQLLADVPAHSLETWQRVITTHPQFIVLSCTRQRVNPARH